MALENLKYIHVYHFYGAYMVAHGHLELVTFIIFNRVVSYFSETHFLFSVEEQCHAGFERHEGE